jgi:hypothetical protein
MTIQDASNELFTWFEKHDNFEIGRDLRKVVPIMEDEEATNIAFKIALEKLEEMGLLCSKDYAEKKYYILDKPMDAFQQNVDVGPWTAKFIAQEINEFCDLLEDQTDVCTVSSIQEKDVRNLVHVIQWYKQRVLEKENIISGKGSNDPVVDLLAGLSDLPEKFEENPEEPPEESPPTKGKKKK